MVVCGVRGGAAPRHERVSEVLWVVHQAKAEQARTPVERESLGAEKKRVLSLRCSHVVAEYLPIMRVSWLPTSPRRYSAGVPATAVHIMELP